MKVTCSTWKGGMRADAIALYARGLSCRKVAEILRENHGVGPSQESIHQWVKAAGILRTKTRAQEFRYASGTTDARDQIRERCRELHRRKLTTRRIAKELGVSRNFVRRAITIKNEEGNGGTQ